jgi:hypothetical protein
MGISRCPFSTNENPETYIFLQNNNNDLNEQFFIKKIPNQIFKKMRDECKNLEAQKNINNKNIKIKKIAHLLDGDNGQNEIYYHGAFNEKNQKHGIGKLIIINPNNENIFYCGIWENDVLNEGKIFYMNEEEYFGKINNYLREGYGKYTSASETYEGLWKNDQKDGNGEVEYVDGYKYKGQFKNNKFNGKGKLTGKDGSYYEGEFADNLFNGNGYLEGSNKHIYSGSFKNGKYNGKGEFKWIDETGEEKYKGSYFNGKKDGEGEFYLKNGHIYKGNWENGKPEGKGVYETRNRKYYGNWRKGMFMQLIEAEDKEGAEEESFNFNFIVPDEDINFIEYITSSIINNASIKSTIRASIEIIT